MKAGYGIVNNKGQYYPVGASVHGAKVSASHHGHTVIAKRSPLGYNIDIVAVKEQGQWKNFTTSPLLAC